jgi:hypothetical protein
MASNDTSLDELLGGQRVDRTCGPADRNRSRED